MYTKSSILSLMNCAKEQSENWTLNRFNSNIILKHRTETEAQCFAVCCHILAFVILTRIFEFHVSADSGSDTSSNSGGGTSSIDTTAISNSNHSSRQAAYTPLVGWCSGHDDDEQWHRTRTRTPPTPTRNSH